MKKLKKLFRKFHNKNQGLTLVEMIVTFMLIGLFMIAASKVIANTVSVYYTAKGTANGMQVSSIIASKIRGEIEGARNVTITTEVKNEDGTTSEVTLPYVMQLSTDATLGGQNRDWLPRCLSGWVIHEYQGSSTCTSISVCACRVYRRFVLRYG